MTETPTSDDARGNDRNNRDGTEVSEHGVPRTTTTGDPDKDYRQKDDGANSEFRAHGRRGPYQDVDSDDHAWDPPEADDA